MASARPNLIKDLPITRLDQVWVADLTYIQLPTTFVYLAAILDAYSRRCIGWQLSTHIDTQLTLAALERALLHGSPILGDPPFRPRGAVCQHRLRRPAGGRRVPAQHGRRWQPLRKRQIESFFKTLKREEVYLNDYQSFAEAEAHLDHFIETVYNHKRLHSSLGYRPPAEFEALVIG